MLTNQQKALLKKLPRRFFLCTLGEPNGRRQAFLENEEGESIHLTPQEIQDLGEAVLTGALRVGEKEEFDRGVFRRSMDVTTIL